MPDLDGALETGADRPGQVLGVFGGLIGQERLEQAAFERVGNVIDNGMDGEAAPAQIGDVEGDIVVLASQAGEFPDDHAGGGRLDGVDHLQKAVTPGSGGARAGGILVPAGDDQAVLSSPGGDLVTLALNGEILLVATAVTQVGSQAGAGEKRGIGQRVRLFTLIRLNFYSISAILITAG